jgi:predicted ATP-grasp superfamily ATP-dependent carboligase
VSRILICDGEQRTALAAVRSLGRAGHHVDLCSHVGGALAATSRYISRFALVPDPLAAPDTFVPAVHRLASQLGSAVVLPVTDQSSAALLPARDQFAGVTIPGPDADAFRRASDKRLVLAEAAALGIATPRQIVLTDATEVAQIEADHLPFPVVIKPGASVRGGRRWSVSYAGDEAGLARALASLPAEAYPVMLQQRIVGPGCAIFLLVWNGQTIATFAHRRRREFPPSGGASVYCASVAADPALVERSRALLDRFGWQGVAMVEFKLDAATATPYLMEVNGRLWGSLQLAIDAGVDFPRLLVEAATGMTPEPVATYRVGVSLRSEWRDVDALLLRLRHNRERLELPPDAPGRLAVLADFLHWRPGERCEVLRLDDPRPFLASTRDWLLRR